MSRQEQFAWASIISTTALALCYLVFVLGLPAILDPTGENLIRVIFWLFAISFAVDLGIEFFKWLGGRGVDRDERDDQIKAFAIRNAYWVLLIATMVLTGQMFVQNLIGRNLDPEYLFTMQIVIMHFLIVVLFASQLTKNVTQVVLYRRGV